VNALLGADALADGDHARRRRRSTTSCGRRTRPRASCCRAARASCSTRAASRSGSPSRAAHASEVAYVELGYPSELLKNNVVLVDTPGVNDLNEQRAEVTYGYVPRADAVVFLLDAGQALKGLGARVSSAAACSRAPRIASCFVAREARHASRSTSAPRVVEYVRNGLAKLTDTPVLFPLSAKDWAKHKDAASGMPELMQYLERFLARDRAQVNPRQRRGRRRAPRPRTSRTTSACGCARTTSTSASWRSTSRRCASSSTRPKRKLDELHVRIDADASSIKGADRPRPGGVREGVRGTRLARIRSTAVDAKRRQGVPAAVHRGQVSRSGAELEGREARRDAGAPRRGGHHDHERERRAGGERRSPSGSAPDDTNVEISVDSFKYDVGIYAVGRASARTVMLFVNAGPRGGPVDARRADPRDRAEVEDRGVTSASRRRRRCPPPCSTPPMR